MRADTSTDKGCYAHLLMKKKCYNLHVCLQKPQIPGRYKEGTVVLPLEGTLKRTAASAADIEAGVKVRIFQSSTFRRTHTQRDEF